MERILPDTPASEKFFQTPDPNEPNDDPGNRLSLGYDPFWQFSCPAISKDLWEKGR